MKCPYCAGEIEEGVLKCMHCGEWLDKEHRAKEQKVQKAQETTGGVAKWIGIGILLTIFLALMGRACH